MMICPKCHTAMRHVYSFSPKKNCEFDVCKNCYFETKHKRLKYDSIEIMQNNTEHKVKKIKPKKEFKSNNKPNKKRKKGKKK